MLLLKNVYSLWTPLTQGNVSPPCPTDPVLSAEWKQVVAQLTETKPGEWACCHNRAVHKCDWWGRTCAGRWG